MDAANSDDDDSDRSSRLVKLANDPFRYIRRVKGGQYQVRPIDLGQRYNLGCFKSLIAARRALDDFWWGRLPDKPKFVRPARHRCGTTVYFVIIPIPAASDPLGSAGKPVAIVKFGPYRTARNAARQAKKYLSEQISAGRIPGPLEAWLRRR